MNLSLHCCSLCDATSRSTDLPRIDFIRFCLFVGLYSILYVLVSSTASVASLPLLTDTAVGTVVRGGGGAEGCNSADEGSLTGVDGGGSAVGIEVVWMALSAVDIWSVIVP